MEQELNTYGFMIDRLENVKVDLELEHRIASKTAEYETLVNETAKAVGVLAGYRNGVIRPIQEAEQAFRSTMQTETQLANQILSELHSNVADSINGLTQTSSSAIERAQKQGEGRLNSIENNVWQKLFNLSLVLEARIGACIDETDKWGKVKEEAGQYTYYINQAILLFGPLAKPESILSLDPWVPKQIAKRLHLYAQKKLAGVKTKFPKSIASQEWSINDLYEVQVTSVTEALALIMEDLLRE